MNTKKSFIKQHTLCISNCSRFYTFLLDTHMLNALSVAVNPLQILGICKKKQKHVSMLNKNLQKASSFFFSYHAKVEAGCEN